MSSYKKNIKNYLIAGVTVLLIPLAQSLLSVVVNRYMDKLEANASDRENKGTAYTRPVKEMME